MTDVNFLQLRALVFCKKFEKTDDGINLTAIHDTRFSGSFPTCFDELCLYASFEASSQGKPYMFLQVRKNDGPIQDVAHCVAEIDEGLVALTPLDLSKYEFSAPGRYSFALYVEGALVGSTSLTIHEMGKPASA